jgi:integrase
MTYLIKVKVTEGGEGSNRSSIRCKTFIPPEGLSEKQVTKRLEEAAAMFENHVRLSYIQWDGQVKLSEYMSYWIDNRSNIAYKTRERYLGIIARISKALGHIPLEELHVFQIEEFYRSLQECGANTRHDYAVATNLRALLKRKQISVRDLSKNAKLTENTVYQALLKRHVSIKTAKKIGKAIGVSPSRLFSFYVDTQGLTGQSLVHYHRLLCAILEKAVREGLIVRNIARVQVDTPKIGRREAAFLDDVQAKELVELLLLEKNMRIRTAVLLLLTSGMRRGEMVGLTWHDVDFVHGAINVKRAQQFQKGEGVVDVPTKNPYSERTIRLPDFMMVELEKYMAWQRQNDALLGRKWQAQDKLFKRISGEPIHPDTINYWVKKFRTKHDLPRFTPHSLRHTFATLQIMAGVSIRTIQARMGHSQASTLLDIYAHAVRTADELATNALSDILISGKTRMEFVREKAEEMKLDDFAGERIFAFPRA